MKIKHLLLFLAFSLSSLALSAQEENAKAIFRFVVNDDAFYERYRNNAEELDRLSDYITRHYEKITNGTMPIYVEGYSSDLLRARTMSNRIKTALILRNNLKEEHFLTRNQVASYAGTQNLVVVRITFVADEPVPQEELSAPVTTPVQEQPAETPATAPAEGVATAVESQPAPETESAEVACEPVELNGTGGVKGRVVSRGDRTALSNVKVTIESMGLEAETDAEGNFLFEGLPTGIYNLKFETPDYEASEVAVRVDEMVKDTGNISLLPDVQAIIDDSIFAEFDSDEATDTQSAPSSLSSSRDLFNSIASYKFSEMRFNVRGYDSQYSSIYLNGIRFNDALTGFGPWSLWSGLNDATRNQENTPGLESSGFGIDGVGGTTNVNARASQVRKGFRASVVNGNSMYRFRVMLSYGSGLLDNGWSYALSFSTRQGGNGYVDGIYYNAWGYFGSVEKRFGGDRHALALTVLGVPTERGAQQASTQEAYDLLGNNYYNPNVGLQCGELRNTRVRQYHEPIVMLNYNFDISDRTKLSAAASFRFGQNGYSALTWMDGQDPRPDYYRYLPSFYMNRSYQADPSIEVDETTQITYNRLALLTAMQWQQDPQKSRINFDEMYRENYNRNLQGESANYMIEERHTDQRDANLAVNFSHAFRGNMKLRGGLAARLNRTEYYNEVKDLLGGDYWLDIDKFARRDMGDDPLLYQNDVAYYKEHGEARHAKEGDKVSYDYYAHVRMAQLWAMYDAKFGGFEMSVGGEIGYTDMWREGLWQKGLFIDSSLGNSEKLNFLTYKVKGEFSYRFSGAHYLTANATYSENAPTFRDAFVSARTRNDVTPGLKTEKILGVDLSYNLTLKWVKARLTGYYTTINDQARVISFYDDTQSSFTNFAMSGIDQRYMGIEFAFTAPIWNGISLNGALSLGDYRYTSNADFVQTVDNSTVIVARDKVLWKNYRVESSPQTALNIGLSYRSGNSWFASLDWNYYDHNYLSMNPARRTVSAYQTVIRGGEEPSLPGWLKYESLQALSKQERLDRAFTINASIGKTWYIQRLYQLGFSLELKNLQSVIRNQNIRTGGYEQMRLSQRTYVNEDNQSIRYYAPFDSKYFYLLGPTYYLNVYFRF